MCTEGTGGQSTTNFYGYSNQPTSFAELLDFVVWLMSSTHAVFIDPEGELAVGRSCSV